MGMFLPLFLQIFWPLEIQAFTDCSEFILGDCSGDASAVLMQFNTGTQDKCSAHCGIEDKCQFYRFEANPSQGVNCYLFKEPFGAYVNHCDLRGGPKREGADQGSSCFSPTGDTCETSQQEDCYLYGGVIDETDSAPSALACEQIWSPVTARCGLLRRKEIGADCGTMLGCSATKSLVLTLEAQRNVDPATCFDKQTCLQLIQSHIQTFQEL